MTRTNTRATAEALTVTSLRSTRRSNATRLVLAALCALALTAATRTSSAQGRRGPIVVLGLRAPNGDDEAATNMTNALRRAARDAGFDVPDSSPALEQSMAAFGCDESVPADCLAQIAGDLHATRLVYGEVRHHGRGPTAQLEISVTLYDNTTHTSPGHDSATAPRSTGMDNDALNPMAHRMLGTLLPAPAAVAVPDPNQVVRHRVEPPPPPPPGPALPVRRYIGIGAIAVGVAGVGVGLLAFGLPWLLYNNHLNDQSGLRGDTVPGGVPGANDTQVRWLWQTFRNDTRNGGAVCSSAASMQATSMAPRPSTDTPVSAYRSPDMGQISSWQITNATTVCQQSSGMQTGQWAFTIGGAVVAVLGIVLVATDHTGAAPPPDAHARHTVRPTFAVLPSLSPSYQGADFVLRF